MQLMPLPHLTNSQKKINFPYYMQTQSIPPRELNNIISNGVPQNCIVLDVRTPAEFAEGHIDGAINIELSALTGNEKILQNKDKIFTVCKGGVRAGKACQKVADVLSQKMYVVEGGMDGWSSCNLPIKVSKSFKFSIMQQMQIIVGFCVVVGSILALTICRMFAVIPLFFGLGLLFAGLSGACLLVKLLGKLPWNKV